MSRRPTTTLLLRLHRSLTAGALSFALPVLGVGCAGSATGQDAGPGQAAIVSVGVRFTHRASSPRSPAATTTVAAQGQFARYRADQAQRAAALLGASDDGAIAIDTCRLVDGQSELDRALAGSTSADVQLLDAGRIVVRGPLDQLALEPRHYPPLTAEVAGVFYDTAAAPELTAAPGAPYVFTGQGGEEVGPFSVEVALPRSAPLVDAPLYQPGTDLELRWSEPDEATGEPLSLAVSFRGAGAREVRCRVRDDGAFTVGRELLAGLPATAGAEVTLTRVRRAGFVAPGAGPGEAELALVEVAPLQVAP